MAIPALLAKKAGAPVMMRVSREEESYFGRARTSMVGRAKVGFTKDGRITALDLFIVQDGGPYGPMGDHRSAGTRRVADLSAGGDAVARRQRADEHAAAHAAAIARADAGQRHHRAVITKAAKQLGHRPGRDPAHELARRQGAVRSAGRNGSAAT